MQQAKINGKIKGTGLLPDKKDPRDYRFMGSTEPFTIDFDIELVLGYRTTCKDYKEFIGDGWSIKRYQEIIATNPPRFEIPTKDQHRTSSCFKYNTPVLMEDFNYKEISKIKKGDRVFTHKGNIEKVSETFKRKWQGTTKTIKLWGDYREIEVTKEHPFYAIKKPKINRYGQDKNGKTTWIKNEEILLNQEPNFYEIKDLEKGDWIAMPFNDIVKDKTIYSIEKNPDFLWLLGLYMAEGSISKYSVSLSLHRKEFGWYKRIKKIMGEYDANVTYSFKEENGLTIIINGEKWSKLFLELGGKMCDKKEINKRLMFLEPHLQMKIYEGIADGDGCYRDKSTAIVSTSKKMLIQCRAILLRNGIFSSLQKRKPIEGKKQAWVLETSNNKSRYSFIKGKYVYARIKNITNNKNYTGGYVYNLEVEKDNSYIVNCLAVHNCVGQAWATYLSVLNMIETGKWVDISERDVYAYIRFSGGGANIKDGAVLSKERGVATLDLVPTTISGRYMTEAEIAKKPVETEAIKAIRKALKSKSYAYDPYGEPNTIAWQVFMNFGAVFGVYGENNSTWHSAYPKVGEKEWGHALFIGRVKITDELLLGVKNSWGDVIGEKGWQWLNEAWSKGMEDYTSLAWTLVDEINYNHLIKPKMSNVKIIRNTAGNGKEIGFYIPIKSEEAFESQCENYGIEVPKNDNKIDWENIKIDGETNIK